MVERRPTGQKEPAVPPAPPASDSNYTDDEEAEVQKRLEDLGYVE